MSMRTLVCAIAVQLTGNVYNGTLFPAAAIVAVCAFLACLCGFQFYRSLGFKLEDAQTSTESVDSSINQQVVPILL